MGMRDFLFKIVGGIRRRIFILILVIMILMTVAFAALLGSLKESFYFSVSLSSAVQSISLAEVAGEVMESMIENDMKTQAMLESLVIDDMFKQLGGHVILLEDYVSEVFAETDSFEGRQILTPDKFRPGTMSSQFLIAPDASLADPMVKRDLAVFGELTGFMESLARTGWLNSCIVSTPSGITIITDNTPEFKVNEYGPIPYDGRTRAWYIKAVETGALCFTDVEQDYFTDNIGVVCACPIYIDGHLAAVVAADLFLDKLENTFADLEDENGFVFVINQNGQVIYSPKQSGILKTQVSEDAVDLRSPGSGLSAFITGVLEGRTDTMSVDVEGTDYYMSGSLMPTLGWAVITVEDSAVVHEPMDALEKRVVNAMMQSTGSLETMVNTIMRIGLLILSAIFLGGCVVALIISAHITKPIRMMTGKLKSLKGNDLDFVMEKTYRTHDEIEVLAGAFEELSQRTKLYIQEITQITSEKERIGAELNVATQIQADMLPSIFPPYPDQTEFDLFATMTPAKEVGGDFYDFFMTDENHIALVMADVSGKGVPAALFMVIAKTILKNRAMLGGTPSEILKDVNEQLCGGDKTQLFVTIWLAIIDIRTGKGVAANAGHEHPALSRNGGPFKLVKYRHSPVIGMMDDIDFPEHEFQLDPGDTLFVYTDGVTEANDAEGRLFGDDRLVEALNSNPDVTPEGVIENVRAGIRGFVAGAEQFDDITMLCFKFKGPDKFLNTDELEVAADSRQLDTVLSFIDDHLKEVGCPTETQTNIDIAVEEIFVNIAHYAYRDMSPGKAWIKIGFDRNPLVMNLRFIDTGKPFDPVAKPEPDVTLKAEDRRIGGLGIYMVKKSMDSMEYERLGVRNVLTMTKRIG